MKHIMFALLAMLLVTLPQWSFNVTAAPSQQEPSCLFLTEAVSGEGGFSVCDDASARFRTAFEQWGLQKIGYPISQRYTRDGFVTQAFQKAIMQWRPEMNSVVLVNIFDDLHNDGFDETLLAVRQTPEQLPPGWDGDIPFEEVVKKRQALLDERPALRAAYFEVGDPLTFYGLPTSEIEDMENHYAIRLQRSVLQEWKEDVPWASAGQVTIANGGDIAKELGALSVEALIPETESTESTESTVTASATSTIAPTPTMTPEEVEETPETVSLPTTCGDLNAPARLVVYGYVSKWDPAWAVTRDPAPDGSLYEGNLLLDDSIPDQDTDDSLAHLTYNFTRQADDYFRQLRLEGFGIWDGCYGTAATERIMTSRIHYNDDPNLRAGFQGKSYAEVLFHDYYITEEIVAHEWAHGLVIGATGGAQGKTPMLTVGGPNGETGALAESLSDIFAILVVKPVDYNLRSFDVIERSLAEPTSLGQVDHVADYDENYENDENKAKYYNAGIPSYAAYLMMEGGTHPAGPKEKDGVTYNPITVNALGQDKVARIYFHALNPAYGIQTDVGFETFARGVIRACQDIAADSTLAARSQIIASDCQEVENAFHAVGMLRAEPEPEPEPESSEGLIAFASNRDHLGEGHRLDPVELYVMKPDGSEQTRLTLSEGWARNNVPIYSVQWLPNGREIAVQPPASGGYENHAEVYIVDRFTKSQRVINLVSGEQLGLQPVWSPNGNKIVLTSRPTGPEIASLTIYIADSNGQNWDQLTTPPSGGWGDYYPTWSPNGNQIAFSRFVRDSRGIFVVEADGSGLRQVFRGSSRLIDWSPDGTKLAFEQLTSEDFKGMDISVIDVNGGPPINLTNTPDIEEWSPSWSPDGTSIVYQVDDGDNAQIWIMDADGTNKRQLTFIGANTYPDWSP